MMINLTRLGKQPVGEVIDSFYVPIDEIWNDEPATFLREYNHLMEDGRSKGRFQEIHVLRSSYVGAWFYYLGPSNRFSAQEFQVVGGSVRDNRQDIETVESIRDYADWLRDEGGIRRAIDPESLSVTQANWIDTLEERAKTRRHQSVSGRYVKVER